MVVIIASTPQAERAAKQLVSIHSSIVAVSEMYAIVGTCISMVACGNTEVEVVAVGVTVPNTHSPRMTYHIYRTIEVVAVHKLAVLSVAKYIHEVFVTYIQQIVVIVNGIVVSVYHIIYHLVHLIKKIKVDFIHIVVLTVRESQLVSHTISKETCFTTDVCQTHRCETLRTDSCQGYKH